MPYLSSDHRRWQIHETEMSAPVLQYLHTKEEAFEQLLQHLLASELLILSYGKRP